MVSIISLRLKLRPFLYSDLDAIHEYASNPDVTQYTLFGPNTLDETRAFLVHVIENEYKSIPQRSCEYGIEYESKLIGAVSIHYNGTFQEAEVGWILNPKYQHQGFAYEAASALIKYGVNNFPLKRIIAHCDSRNTASYKLMEKLGMKFISIEKGVKIEKIDGIHYRDEMLYELRIE